MTGNSKRKAVVLLSGGLDSMVTARLAQEQGFDVAALTIDYGQRHVREVAAARLIAQQLGIMRHTVLALDLRSFGGSALTAEIAVPKGGLGADIPATYVPARNLVFLSLTTAFAETLEARAIFIGVNAVDYSGYPDCRPEFIKSFAETARLGTKQGVEGAPFAVHTPLQHMSKADIAAECARLGLDPAWSWSCYDPQSGGLACGLCDSCRLRKKGFAASGIKDTTRYAG
ncbi:7-cyano-7-deazaguanine synthase QueC [Porphyrobacter sp. GA68]|uniref:7-cyano-7-deazaguanine synthase QueC n=1 Tax=Porphyrobacter sp. GA68 TaxID=2883480 RepID=UPI001D18AAB9|nr:7-cyano-7-deazaguanine synthase QueC [Porphyrobacter sp. GA68]